jgi:hypothetical protein
MNSNIIEAQPIVCDLTAISPAERTEHLANAARIFQAAEEIRELPDGYAFRLPNEPGVWMALAHFVENERRCCPFWAFALAVEPHGGPLWLQLSAGEQGKQFLELALGDYRGQDAWRQLIHTGGESQLDHAVAQAARNLSGVLAR